MAITVWSRSACNWCAGLADIVLASYPGTNTLPTTATAAGATEATPGPLGARPARCGSLARSMSTPHPGARFTASDDDWR